MLAYHLYGLEHVQNTIYRVFDFLFSFGMHSWSIFSGVAFDRPVKNSIVECICLDLNAFLSVAARIVIITDKTLI